MLPLAGCGDGEVPNLPPVAAIANPSRDTAVVSPYAVDFLGTATDADGAVVSHHWAFGDGKEASVEDPGPYSYEAAGVYNVTYQVTDEDGAVSSPVTVVVTVTATGIAPQPGNWFGTMPFSLLQFTLNGQGTAITEVVLILDTLPCGGGHPQRTRVTSSNPGGWPLSGLDFAIETTFPEVALGLTLNGSFTSHTEASGTWAAVSSGTACAGTWETDRAAPDIAVTMSANFTRTLRLNGFNWLAGRAVRLEIDNHADGTIDFDSTARADRDGVVRFTQDTPSFAVAEGDSIRMDDGLWRTGFVVLYVTLDAVDATANLIRGRARQATRIRVTVHDPTLPSPQGPEILVSADTAGTWQADFSGLFDILIGTEGLVTATCPHLFGGMACGGSTMIEW